MLSYQEIFNIQRTTLPLSKKELENVLTKSVFTGYVQCSYSVLVQTLKELATAESCKCTINPDVMYQNTNNPFLKADCINEIIFNRKPEDGYDTHEYLKDMKHNEVFTEQYNEYKEKYLLP